MDEGTLARHTHPHSRTWVLPLLGGLWTLPFAYYVLRFLPPAPFLDRMSGPLYRLWTMLPAALAVALFALTFVQWRARGAVAAGPAATTLVALLLLNLAAVADYQWRLKTLGLAYRHVPMDARSDVLSDMFFHWRSPWQLGAFLLLAAALHGALRRRFGDASLREAYLRLALVVAPFVLAFGALEIYLQLGPSRQPWAMYQGFSMLRLDYTLGWSHAPNLQADVIAGGKPIHIRTNSKGLRDRERTYKVPPGIQRILCLGDSFAFGWGVEATDRLTDVLENRFLRHTEVINAAVEGYGTDQQYLYLQREGFRYHPRVVLLAMFPGNDFEDNTRSAAGGFPKPRFEVGPTGLRLLTFPTPGQQQGQGPPDPFFFRYHSRAYQCLARRIYLLCAAAKARRTADTSAMARRHPASNWIRERPEGYDVTRALLAAMAEECRRHHARFLILMIAPGELIQIAPDSPQAGDRWRYLARCYYAAGEICRSLSLSHIDTLAEYTARTRRGEQLYIPSDAHWTPAGHALAAHLVCQKLAQEHMLPPECFATATPGDADHP